MKKILILLALMVVGVTTYVIVTLKSGVELNEISPLETNKATQTNAPQVNDRLKGMDEKTKAEFMRQVEAVKDQVMEKKETMPPAARLLAVGDFQAKFHSVKGQALLIEKGNQKIIRFKDFETDNGPDLHIYLSSDLSNKDFIDLGKIRATKGNVNYELATSADTSRYNRVLVWCVPFGVLFSYAELIAQ